MSDNDSKIRQYQDAIEEKMEALGPRPKAMYQTNCVIPVYVGQGKTGANLHTLTLEGCVNTAAALMRDNVAKTEAINMFGLSGKVKNEIDGYTYEQWMSDIKAKIDSLLWEADKKELTEMMDTLEDLKSNEAKTEDAIGNIASKLGL